MFDSACGVKGAAGGGAGLMTGAPAHRARQASPLQYAATECGATLPALPLRFTDPLRLLLCWAALLYKEGTLDARLLTRAGVGADDLSTFADASPQALSELRALRLAGALFARAELAALMRARLSEMLMGATKPSELLALSKALEHAPGWVWDERGDRGRGAGDREEEGARVRGQGSREEEGSRVTGQGSRGGGNTEGGAEFKREEWAGMAGKLRGMLAGQIEGAEDGASLEQLSRAALLIDKLDSAALTGSEPKRPYNAALSCGPGRKPSATKGRKPKRH